MKKRYTAKRTFSSRGDSSIETLIWDIETKYRLPRGSVKITNPSGRKARNDKTVANLREEWRC
ncbi:hypothetical protein KKB40_01100 [Patescibacteria group bacterium]|nr:hypothetical protein [Patescibacteria group bacterium]